MFIWVILHNFNIFSTLNNICCIHSKIPPDDEYLIYSKHVEDDYWNTLREKSASGWSLLRKYLHCINWWCSMICSFPLTRDPICTLPRLVTQTVHFPSQWLQETVAYPDFFRGGFNKFSWGQRTERGSGVR